MSKVAIGIVLLIIFVVVFGVALFYLRQPGRLAAPQPQSAPSQALTSKPASQPQSNAAIVELTPEGFSPTNLTVAVGTTVTFVNKDIKARWPASGVHPTHQICPGFDPLKPIPPEQSWSFTFTVAKTCPMHDHLYPALKGSITVR